MQASSTTKSQTRKRDIAMTVVAATSLVLSLSTVGTGLCVASKGRAHVFQPITSMMDSDGRLVENEALDIPISPRIKYKTVTISKGLWGKTGNRDLKGWFMPRENSSQKPTIVVMKGNSKNIGARVNATEAIANDLDVNVLIVDWSGYGASAGNCSETHLMEDAMRILNYVFEELEDIDRENVFVWGHSLGVAASLTAATQSPFASKIRGLILENGFTSLLDMAKLKHPVLKYVPFVFTLAGMTLDNIARVQTLQHPTLFLNGSEDAVIPPHMTQTLFGECQAEDKQIFTLQGGTHSLCVDPQLNPQLKKVVSSFLRDHHIKP